MRRTHAALAALWLSVIPIAAAGQSGAGEEGAPAAPPRAAAAPLDSSPPETPPAPGAEPPPYKAPKPPPRPSFYIGATPADGAPEGAERPPGVSSANAHALLDRFAGSYLNWGQAGNTALFGVGDYFSTESFAYVMSWNLVPSFFAYRSDVHQVRIAADLGLSIELTESDRALRKNELELSDVSLSLSDTVTVLSLGGRNEAPAGPAAAFNPTLAGGSEYQTWAIVGGSLLFPTSRSSMETGRYLATGLSATARQRLKLLGGSAPGLQNVLVSLSGTWRHDFFRANVPTNPDLSLPRQDFAGNAIVSDQISSFAVVENRLSLGGGLILPIYRGLELWSGFSYLAEIKPRLKQSDDDECDLMLPTGCADAEQSTDPRTVFGFTRFYAALAYPVLPELILDVGYENFASELASDGTKANPLHSSNAVFYADVAIILDRLIGRFAGSAPSAPPPAGQ